MAPHSLAAWESVLRDLTALLEDGLVTLDAEDRVVIVSANARNLLGGSLREGEALAASHVDYRVLRLVAAARESRQVQQRELELDGHVALVRALSSSLEEERGLVLLLIRDLTQLRHLQRVRRDFVSNVSHELKTPVTAIQLMTETLERSSFADRAEARDFIRRIGLEAAHMGHIVEELLQLSSIETSQWPMQRERVDVATLLHALDRLRPLADDKQIHIEVSIDPGTPHILGDASALAQVIRNRVHNAIKFTPAGGRIDVEGEPAGDRLVRLRCRDTGPGIAPPDQQRVFERFWKADSARQPDGEGSGLGLAIVRHIVEAHGGTVSLASEPRRGAEFTVDLPAAL